MRKGSPVTYYQKKRVIAKLKRIQNHVKYQELGYGPEALYLGLTVIDRVIREHIDEPCTFVRGNPLPRAPKC